jgi:hypothetical protein
MYTRLNKSLGWLLLFIAVGIGLAAGYWFGRGKTLIAAGILSSAALVALGSQLTVRSRTHEFAVWDAYAEREIARGRSAR